jgi:hypothetical protein
MLQSLAWLLNQIAADAGVEDLEVAEITANRTYLAAPDGWGVISVPNADLEWGDPSNWDLDWGDLGG